VRDLIRTCSRRPDILLAGNRRNAQLALLALALTLALQRTAVADSASLAADLELQGHITVARLHVAGGGPVLILADGWLAPSGEELATLSLTVDGVPTGSRALLDWRGAHHPVTHGFRVLAAPTLPPGDHVVALQADTSKAATIGAGTLLSVLQRPARLVLSSHAPAAALTVQTNTPALTNTDELPHSMAARVQAGPADDPVVALAAGTVSYAGDGRSQFGDALWGLWVDGAEATANQAGYADNDICRCAELQAPLAVQGLFPRGNVAGRALGLGASAEPWAAKLSPDQVRYTVAPETLLVLLSGMEIAGGLTVLDQTGAGGKVARFPYMCVASSHDFTGCPAAGTPNIIGGGTLTVPAGHTRPILFSASFRLQGDGHDGGGHFTAWIEIDGKRAGSPGVQALSPASAVSTRTVTLSYLAQALAPGRHHVALWAQAQGDFLHLAVTRNLPLIWFD
jgi:hypothetical protein